MYAQAELIQPELFQRELFEPMEYLDYTGTGFFSVLTKPDGKGIQNSYPLDKLPQIIMAADTDRDTWISQASFRAPNRRAVNVNSVGLLFADLDTYHTEGLAEKDPDALTNLFLLFCSTEGIPEPSLVIFSGRGLQPKWLLTEAIGSTGVVEWARAEAALIRALFGFAVDPVCRDVSRVLRLDGTRNTKSGEAVRIIHNSGNRYDFDDLAAALLRIAPEPTAPEISPTPSTRKSGNIIYPGQFAWNRLAWARMQDIRTLWTMRGGVQEGYREITLFWEMNFLALSRGVSESQFWHEARALAHEIAPGEDFYKETDLTTIYQKTKDTVSGKTISYRGREYPALYTPKNGYLIDLFKISSAEERQLLTIISKGEKRRRDYAKREEDRRAAGSREYTGITKAAPWEAEGISRRTWYRRREKGNQ